MFGQISGRILRLFRASCVRTYTERKIPARRMPSPRRQGRLCCRKPCAGRGRIFRIAPTVREKRVYFQNSKTNYVVFPTELG